MLFPINFSRRVAWRGVIAACAMSCMTGLAFGAWPERPISLIVSYPAGGSVDYVARLIAPALGKKLGQQVIIENVSGAAGTIGAARVAAAKRDGYTLMLGSGSEVSIAPVINTGLRYDGLKDLAPVALVGTSPMVLVGGNGIGPKTLDDLIRYAKANPGKLSLATAGVGSPQHLLLEFINRQAGIDITHIPYRGAGPILNDVIAGRTELSILTLTTVLSQIEAGNLRGYAVTGKARALLLPNVPTLEENVALKGADFSLWFGVLAPQGVSEQIALQVNAAVRAALEQQDVKDGLKSQGIESVPGTSKAFAEFVKADSEKYRRIVKTANISIGK